RARRWNPSNNSLYLRQQKEGNVARESEELTSIQSLNEYIMISLRTSEGMNLQLIEKKWGSNESNRIKNQLLPFIQEGLLILDQSTATLTDEGMLRADGMAAEMFSEVKRQS